jgi:hypothetical protein
MSAHPNALGIPPDAHENAAAAEILRAWSVNGGLHVSLKPSFENPAIWGLLLVDLARHAARAYAVEGRQSEASVLRDIRRTLDAEWQHSTDAGTTSAVQ